MPIKVSACPQKFKKPVWISHKAVKLVKMKRKVYRRYKDTFHPAVRAANSEAQKELRKSVINFENKLALNIKSDWKSFFAYVRSRTKSKVQTEPLSKKDGQVIESLIDMVNEFNSYFLSVFTSEDLSNVPNTNNLFLPDVRCRDVIFAEEDVQKKLSALREDKAADPDNLSPRVLLQIKDQISYPLFLLFCKSTDEGSVPEDWKKSNVNPIFKKGSRSQAENYRPVSLTSVICKVFESLIRDAMVKY